MYVDKSTEMAGCWLYHLRLQHGWSLTFDVVELGQITLWCGLGESHVIYTKGSTDLLTPATYICFLVKQKTFNFPSPRCGDLEVTALRGNFPCRTIWPVLSDVLSSTKKSWEVARSSTTLLLKDEVSQLSDSLDGNLHLLPSLLPFLSLFLPFPPLFAFFFLFSPLNFLPSFFSSFPPSFCPSFFLSFRHFSTSYWCRKDNNGQTNQGVYVIAVFQCIFLLRFVSWIQSKLFKVKLWPFQSVDFTAWWWFVLNLDIILNFIQNCNFSDWRRKGTYDF